MNEKMDVRRTAIFLGFAFGIAWTTGLVLYLTGGLVGSPMILPGISLALVLLAGPYMWAPALAHIFTRLVTREGWQGAFLRPNFRRGWPFWIIAWFLPAILTVLGAVVFFGLFPQYFDPSLGVVAQQLATAEQQTGQAIPLTPWMVVIINSTIGVLIAPLINSLFTFGEEFGWRSYLLQKLMPLGGRKAMLLMGVIWGVWHWPVIAMGHNYGLDYVGAPWLGMLMMVVFTVVMGIFLGWVALRGGSVWPAVIGHAAINGVAGLAVYFIQGEPNPLLGPLPVGLIAMIPGMLVAAWIFASRSALVVPEALVVPDAKLETAEGAVL
ncbi:MAG: CPBP family intramembrane metalloprotease [Chloroflexi bacterium]|nr:MAG: CPBP family intramembrane metalloprotease [Chloroflexota bacterium]